MEEVLRGETLRVAVIADAFPPLRSSGAVQLRDLALELVKCGHEPTVMVSSPELDRDFLIERWGGIQIVRLKAPKTKDMGYIRRTLGEFLMPFMMAYRLQKSPLVDVRWDGLIWYSPSIFLGPMVSRLKRKSKCKAYLILRDIFPEWAVDMGLMKRGVPYRFFKAIEAFQYSVANTIGVQTRANLGYLRNWSRRSGRELEVLQNWLSPAPDTGCSLRIADGPLADRKIFVYAGNMGVAQGMDLLIELAARLRHRKEFGFLFVGRGSDVPRLKTCALERRMENVLFADEIDPSEIPGLYAQCHVGVVTLDPRHRTHNIPGKFLSYMQCGLPVLASVNPGNDLAGLIASERVGKVCVDASLDSFEQLALGLAAEVDRDSNMRSRCTSLGERLFSPQVAVQQIVSALAS